MNKYHRLQKELEEKGTGNMKCYGNSMVPILESGGLLTFVRQESYNIGDVVFCKVKGRFIDAHKITKKDSIGRYLISNNHGFDNGWTKNIFGKAISAQYSTKIIKL